MRKFLWLAIAGVFLSSSVIAQDSSKTKPKKDWSKVNLSKRANDHFLIQFGYDWWSGRPDSIQITGFPRHFNFYVMYDMPFKTNPHFSLAGGVGVGTSGMFFDKMDVDIIGKTRFDEVVFSDSSKGTHFKKNKISTTWLEIPVEFRYVGNAVNTGRGFKLAIGGKIGTMVDAHTKGKNLETEAGASIYGTKYIEKEKSRRYFNSLRLAGTIRVGYGPVTIYGAYQFGGLFKEGQGPKVNVCSIGTCISGL